MTVREIFACAIIVVTLPGTDSLAMDSASPAPSLVRKKDWEQRQQRVNQWYAPARFGMFCHWGLFTGGGDSSTEEAHPFAYNTIAEFEAAASDPDLIASNLVTTAKEMGARYITFTLLHSCDRYAVMFPTKTPGFKMKTTRDYIGALASCCRQEKIPLLLYLCGGPDHAFDRGGPWLEEPLRDGKKYVAAIKGLLDELAAMHGREIAGFWIDGNTTDLPAYMRRRFPGCIVIHNNDGSLANPDIDYSTTEFLSGPADPEYSRPTGLVKTQSRWNILPPRRDFNEDIPSVGPWWYQSNGKSENRYSGLPYVKEPTFIVRQMVSSLGGRGQWNFAIGVGPMIDGKLPSALDPMVESLHQFFTWASESIYDTTGGDGSALNPGWWNDGAYGSVTISRKDPKLLYVHVTTAPASNTLRVCNNGYKVVSVVDLRTHNTVSYTDSGFLIIQNRDWSDVAAFGDKVFKITLADK